MSKYSDVSARISSPMVRAHICADCSTPDPTWASINRGVLVCDECCSVHRSLGRHISQVKSLKRSSWSPSLLSMVQLVSSFANNIWEHLLKDPSASQNKHKHRKPNPRDPTYPTKAEFIRAKYHFLSFMNKHRDSEVITVDDISKQLHSSVRTTSLETSLRLLSLGADPNYFHSEKENYPLHIAAQSGQFHQAELLIVYGADPGAYDSSHRTPVDYARKEGHNDLAERLLECQYELTDRLAHFLCKRKPDHRNGQHFIIPEMAENSVDLSELAKSAKKRLQGIHNKLFEDLAMDVYDEVDRRENESLWLASQNSSDVSDKQTVPFLPVNPEFTSTRNQGRQKLARFNPREFATLIIDILGEVKRRQHGLSSPVNIMKDLDKLAILRKAPSNRSMQKTFSTISDDEPLYDSVCSDEDYASIGGESLKEEKGEIRDNKDLGKGEMIDKSEMKSSPTSVESLTESITSSEQSEAPITVEEYLDLKRTLVDAQMQIKQLIQTKNDLKQEVALLQNMVHKLLQENQLLRSKEGGMDSGISVSNGLENLQSTSQLYRQSNRPQSMFEPRDPQKIKHWNLQPLREEGAKGEIDDVKTKSSPSVRTQAPLDNQGANSTESDYDNPPPPEDEDNSARSSARSNSSIQLTPTNSNASLPLEARRSMSPNLTDRGGGLEDRTTTRVTPVSMPSQDDVVKKTEKITKKIQELLIRAQESRHDSFALCAEKIHNAVLDMAALFPMPLADKTMQESLTKLVAWSEKLQGMCERSLSSEESKEKPSPTFTQEVIQCAYVIAKAAKQLVIMFE